MGECKYVEGRGPICGQGVAEVAAQANTTPPLLAPQSPEPPSSVDSIDTYFTDSGEPIKVIQTLDGGPSFQVSACLTTPTDQMGAQLDANGTIAKAEEAIDELRQCNAAAASLTGPLKGVTIIQGHATDAINELACLIRSLRAHGRSAASYDPYLPKLERTRQTLEHEYDAWKKNFSAELSMATIVCSQRRWDAYIVRGVECLTRGLALRLQRDNGLTPETAMTNARAQIAAAKLPVATLHAQLAPLFVHLERIKAMIAGNCAAGARMGTINAVLTKEYNELADAANAWVPTGEKLVEPIANPDKGKAEIAAASSPPRLANL